MTYSCKFALMLIACFSIAVAGEESDKSDEEIQQLVACLADYKAVQRGTTVRDVVLALQKVGPKAFPFLIAKFGSVRISLQDAGEDSKRTWTVGDISSKIIRSQIEAFSNNPRGIRGRPSWPSYFDRFFSDRATAQRWYESHKDMSLNEIQIEAIEWTIAEDKKIKGRNKIPASELASLQETLAELKETDEPLPPRDFLAR